MEYTGEVQGGVVVLDNGEGPPEGTRVKVLPLPAEAEVKPPPEGETLGERLMKFAGTVRDLPSDMAEQHDHYLYGTPKR